MSSSAAAPEINLQTSEWTALCSFFFFSLLLLIHLIKGLVPGESIKR